MKVPITQEKLRFIKNFNIDLQKNNSNYKCFLTFVKYYDTIFTTPHRSEDY